MKNVKQALQHLRKIEWADPCGPGPGCPVCEFSSAHGHAADCELDKAIQLLGAALIGEGPAEPKIEINMGPEAPLPDRPDYRLGYAAGLDRGRHERGG